MTKKHFEAAAAIVRDTPYQDYREQVEDAFVALFSQFNPRFDADKFRAACQPKDSGNL